MYNHANIPQGAPKVSFRERMRQKVLHAFRLTDQPVVKVYHGFGNEKKLSVFGHVFLFSPVPRKHYSKNFLTNTFALLRLFIVQPYRKAHLKMQWNDQWVYAQTEKDGFFRFELDVTTPIEPGWHEVQVMLLGSRKENEPYASGKGTVYIPYRNQFAFISDIDDTFLISHSSRLRKRLYVLLTENAHSRQPFEGVVRHYQLLSRAGVAHAQSNPFFFVSSSEWNLYDYIREFAIKQQLPQGVYLLNQLKQFSQLWKTGQNNHSTKFMRIVRIVEAYPVRKFILLGDDTQEDPTIYASIVAHFPGKIYAVYLRKVRKKTKSTVLPAIERMKEAGVICCYFGHSSEAISHSISIGLIKNPDPELQMKTE
jgi:phosphatidate phosphatase APP1